MYEVRRTGRIIETRISSPLAADEVDGIVQAVRMNVIAQSERVIVFADVRKLEGLPRDAPDAFVAMFSRDNPRLERSALLMSPGKSALSLQLGQMIRAAKSPSRMVFDDVDALEAWLAPALRPNELARLRVFFGPA